MISFVYTNWKGEVETRRVEPIKLYYGSTEWHPKEQWLLEAMDLDKGAIRQFAVNDIIDYVTEEDRHAAYLFAPMLDPRGFKTHYIDDHA